MAKRSKMRTCEPHECVFEGFKLGSSVNDKVATITLDIYDSTVREGHPPLDLEKVRKGIVNSLNGTMRIAGEGFFIGHISALKIKAQ